MSCISYSFFWYFGTLYLWFTGSSFSISYTLFWVVQKAASFLPILLELNAVRFMWSVSCEFYILFGTLGNILSIVEFIILLTCFLVPTDVECLLILLSIPKILFFRVSLCLLMLSLWMMALVFSFISPYMVASSRLLLKLFSALFEIGDLSKLIDLFTN